MGEIEITVFQKRVETLIAEVSILSQDVASLRRRVEEVHASASLGRDLMNRRLDLIERNVDEGFAKVLASNANVTALLEELLGRK
jgi:hypothetical protein